MSIFSQIDRQLSNKGKFWLPTTGFPLEEQQLVSGIMRIPANGSTWKTSKRPRGYVIVSWKPFEPFSESDSGAELFGFRLGNEGCNQDFYVDSADELDVWITCFRKIAILNGVHDDFDFGEKVGEGNYAEVMRATDNESGEVVAIKCITKEKLMRTSQGAKILVNEIDCMRRLDHPNILKLERVYEEEDKCYLVMEFVEGGDLFAKIIAAEKFSERYSAIIARKLLVALAYMHEQNIIHRDLKLENIMMTSLEEEADVKLADFGFAAEMTPENLNVFCGSPGYVAPEILNKLGYDAKADIFSLGIILYIVLSGNSPFFGRSVDETLAKNRECKIKFEAQYWGDISEDARNFIQCVTERNSKARLGAEDALKHRWIQTYNRQYFESLELLQRRPSFSKRRPTVHLSMPKSPLLNSGSPGLPKTSGLPRIKALETSNVPTSPKSSLAYLRTFARNEGVPGEIVPSPIKINRDNEHLKPVVPSQGDRSPVSPFSGSKTPNSVGSRPNKRTITWKQIKPHP